MMSGRAATYFANDDDDANDEDAEVASVSSSSADDDEDVNAAASASASAPKTVADIAAQLPTPPTWLSRLAPSAELRAWMDDLHEAEVQRALLWLGPRVTEGDVRARANAYLTSRDLDFTLLQSLCSSCGDAAFRGWWRSVRHCLFHVRRDGDAAVPHLAPGRVLDLTQSPSFVYDSCLPHIRHANYERTVVATDLTSTDLASALRTFRRDPSVQHFKIAVYVAYKDFRQRLEKHGTVPLSESIEDAVKIVNERAEFNPVRRAAIWPPYDFGTVPAGIAPRTLPMQICALISNVLGKSFSPEVLLDGTQVLQRDLAYCLEASFDVPAFRAVYEIALRTRQAVNPTFKQFKFN